MVCATGAYDLNGLTVDGCEVVLDTGAIYVSGDDTAAADDATCGIGPAGTGAGNHPCRSIGQGLARASVTGRTRVLVADALYGESVTLVNGVNLLGAHDPTTWTRHVATSDTVIEGASSAGNHDRTVIAANITAATEVDGFLVRGSLNAKPSGNSYAIYVTNSGANLLIRRNRIYAGRGGSGASGTPSSNGARGADGIGRDSDPGGYDWKDASGTSRCDSSNNRGYANGGVTTCGIDSVSGGNGGGNTCPTSSTLVELSGQDGSRGQAGVGGGLAGGGGDSGDDMRLESSGSLCVVPTSPVSGAAGRDGQSGAHGPAVPGCIATAGTVVAGHWVGAAAPAGLAGQNGGGGGGGGAGGGAFCLSCPTGKDRLGAHGGGGGAGGCGGMGGGAAPSGGGAFGIFIVGGAAPTVTDNIVTRGAGGPGGSGGAGGVGGIGGAGGRGGMGDFCAGDAGNGGAGGAGGHGSGGGGGCGGGSYGIYTSGVGTPPYCEGEANNTIGGGAGGAGGNGGASLGLQSGAGQAGELVACSFN